MAILCPSCHAGEHDCWGHQCECDHDECRGVQAKTRDERGKDARAQTPQTETEVGG
jgi:hypothetical protein